ncbi:deoxyribonuclease II family protein [Catenovulum sp. SM1970]|uniref:deoxyribonuclease II family protein n=1 Tax=Marinifaba aquimaris TaxID=2741323 RepID=UPI001573D95D|nr:deoxyribonuclease II family protein [Marinifaba aquimaris]NTS78827.1 deoxyribonuclease II family protein [Marinifaba aquimaris]
MLTAKSDISAENVDWWFMYKLPHNIGPSSQKTTGNEYLYYQSCGEQPLALSPYRLGTGENGALYHTLKQLFPSDDANIGWINYNDEYPYSMTADDFAKDVKPAFYGENVREKDRNHPIDNAHNGHCKGTLAFDLTSNTAFWLSHSTPRIPGLNLDNDMQYFYPEYAYQYAQTFICISLEDVSTADKIAAVLAEQHEPQVFGVHLPEAVTQDSQYANLWRLAQGINPPAYTKSFAEHHPQKAPADIEFKSKAGKIFRLIAKSGAWYDDFWINLVGPKLGVDLRVETWRRLTSTANLPTEDKGDSPSDYGKQDFVTTYKGREYHHEFVDRDGQDIVDEITNVDLQMIADSEGNQLTGFNWPYTKDHAKWAISEEKDDRGNTDIEDEQPEQDAWVCIADMNRMSSQEKRGGGAICFHETLLWQGLNEIERISGKIT